MIKHALEIQRTKLLIELDDLFTPSNLDSVYRSAVKVEHFVQQKAVDLLSENAVAIFGATAIDHKNGIFVCGGTEYKIFGSEDAVERNQFSLSIANHDVIENPTRPRLKHRDIKISGHGRFKTIRVFSPRSLVMRDDLLDEVISTGFETTYRWIQERIEAVVRQEANSTARELYSFARTIFLDHRIWKDLWFAAISEGLGFRLLEEHVSAAVLETVNHSAAKFGRGANDLLAEIVKTALPVERLLMRFAIGATEPFDVNISDAGYAHSSYAEAMVALYNATSFTIFPILTDADSQDKVIALYSTSLKSDISPLLDAHLREFRAIARRSHRQIRAIRDALQKRGDPVNNEHPSSFHSGQNSAGREFRLEASDRIVNWNGKSYTTSPLQFACIRALHELAQAGNTLVHQRTVLNRVQTGSLRLRDLFKGHELFDTLIKPEGNGYFSLAIGSSEDDGTF